MSVFGCARNTSSMRAQHFFGFPIYHLTLLAHPTLSPAGRKMNALKCFSRYLKPNFRCRRNKKYIKLNFNLLENV